MREWFGYVCILVERLRFRWFGSISAFPDSGSDCVAVFDELRLCSDDTCADVEAVLLFDLDDGGIAACLCSDQAVTFTEWRSKLADWPDGAAFEAEPGLSV